MTAATPSPDDPPCQTRLQQNQQQQKQQQQECARPVSRMRLVDRAATPFRIAIVGLGPSGLSTALAIQKTFFNHSNTNNNTCIVLDLYDKDVMAPTDDDESCTRKGYGMTLTYNPQTGPLALLDVLEPVAQCDCPSRSHYIFTPQGHILGYYGRYFSQNSNAAAATNNTCTDCLFCRHGGTTQRGSIRIPRHILKRILYQTLMQRNHHLSENNNSNQHQQQLNIYWGKKLLSYSSVQKTPCAKEDVPISLLFEDGTTAQADLLIGADGVHSKVWQCLSSQPSSNLSIPSTSPEQSHPLVLSSFKNSSLSSSSYLGVMLILGITLDFYHPLLDERGFYTVDGEHRLFTMPYEGSHVEDIQHFGILPPSLKEQHSSSTSSGCTHITSLIPRQRRRRYMWQLSFRMDSLDEATTLAHLDSKALLQHVQQRLHGWHTPIEDMIQSTPLDTVWGTPLFDRNPNQQQQQVLLKALSFQHVVVMGDAIHAMSPFKGQGCNQALMDGPLLASWLEKSSLDSALKGFIREMSQRSCKKVQDSRQAATFYHSPAVFSQRNDFSGVVPEKIPLLLSVLKERGITAQFGSELDRQVAQVIQELQVMKVECKDGIRPRQGFSLSTDSIIPLVVDPGIEAKLNDLCPDTSDPSRIPMYYCLIGDTGKLRELSLMDSERIRCAVAVNGMTCLHVAAKEGHYYTCRWLLSDYGMSYNTRDHNEQSPMHAAALGGDPSIIEMLFQISMFCDDCFLSDCDGKTPMDIIASYHPSLIHLMSRETH